MKEDIKYIKGICIKPYANEKDVEEYEEGNMGKKDIKVFQVGEEGDIVDGCYDQAYWKPKLERDESPIKNICSNCGEICKDGLDVGSYEATGLCNECRTGGDLNETM